MVEMAPATIILHKNIVSNMIPRPGSDKYGPDGVLAIHSDGCVRTREIKEEEEETARRSDRVRE